MYGFCSLASGSKGNCTYVGSREAKILIDVGIRVKNVKERLKKIGVALEEIDAVIISHEHSDHIAGIDTLTKHYDIPIFANLDTIKAMSQVLSTKPRFKVFQTGETFSFRGIEIHPFSVQHDTLDPVAFTIKVDRWKLGICTDLGVVTSLVREQLKNVDYLLVEANHQPSMVYASPRPMLYKQRVLSRQGHLSNDACAELIREVLHSDLKKIILAHLSSECNSPVLALKIVEDMLFKEGAQVDLSVATQEEGCLPILFSS